MAVSDPTFLTAAGSSSAGTTSRTTTSFSPSAGALLLLAYVARDPLGSSANTISLTSTSIQSTFAGAGAWTEIAAHADDTHHAFILAYSQMGPSPGSGAITVNHADTTMSRAAWVVCELSGQSTSTPISESTFGETSSSPNIRTLTNILANNLLLAAVATHASTSPSTSDAIGVDADFTELAEIGSGAASPVFAGIFYDPNDDETSGTFTAAAANSMMSQVLVEFAQSTEAVAAGAFILERMERHYPRGHLRGVMRGALHFGIPDVVVATPHLSA